MVTRAPHDAPALSLLDPDEPRPYAIACERGTSPFLLTADHASRRLPRALGTLGLTNAELESHIAWDLGVEPLVRALASELDAFAILHGYSRLAIDPNRPLEANDSIATSSERSLVPGNVGLGPEAVRARVGALFEPYHARIARELDARAAASRPTILVSVHSFTPVYLGVARPWHVGVLYQHDTRFAHALLAILEADGSLVVGDNEPYRLSDDSDYTVPVHGERRGIAHAEIEVRQDLLTTDEGCAAWTARLASAFRRAQSAVFPS